MPRPKSRVQTIQLNLTAEHHAALPMLTKNTGGWQAPYQYMAQTVRPAGDGYVARVKESDLKKLKEFALKAGDGTWERMALEILQHNGIDPNS